MQTNEDRNQNPETDAMEVFSAEADEIEDAIIKLSDYPTATLSLLSSLADLHDRQARVFYGNPPCFGTGRRILTRDGDCCYR